MTDINKDPFGDDHSGHVQPEQLALFVNLDGFEGPIDLLLNLAREQKLDLKNISILPLAEQYLQFLQLSDKLYQGHRRYSGDVKLIKYMFYALQKSV